jgi:hypothetical protein
MKPPNSIAHVAAVASAQSPVKPHPAAHVGGASKSVIASCVFPEGIRADVRCQMLDVSKDVMLLLTSSI